MFRVLQRGLNYYLRNQNGISGAFRRFSSTASGGTVIGIDLGTTNSCVAIMEGSEPRVIANAEGQRTTPSVVAFLEDGQVLVGEAAKRQAVSNSQNTVYGTKRLIGRRFNDPGVKEESKHLPFELTEAKHGDVWVKVRGKAYSPSQIGAHILGKMRETASSYLGLPVKDAVVTVPAYFNDSQRQATKDAGEIAGLNVVRIVNEPTAAALAYGLNKKDLNKVIAVYDLGGGTFDISILEINDGVFEVKSTNGDTRLGGEDFDNVIIKYLIDLINAQFKTDCRQDLKALQRIKEAAEKAKTELSFTPETEINLPYLIGANSFSCKMRRSQLEELVGSLIERTLVPCATALKDAGLGVEKLDEILLVGGMTRMPKVQQSVKEFFRKEPNKGINPDEAVAIGAAIQGGVLVGSVSDIVLVDASAYSLGVRTLGDVFSIIVPKSTNIPTRKSSMFTTSEDNQTYVDISVFQGERSMCRDNLHLGDFKLGPIPARPRGMSQIEVSVELDSNGIMNISAMDVESCVVAKTTLRSNPRGLSKEELKKMAEEAEKMREQDAKLRAVAEATTACETIIYDINRFLPNAKGLEPTKVEEFKKELAELKTKLAVTEGKDEHYFNDIKTKLAALMFEIKRLSEESAKAAQQQSQTDSTESADTKTT